MPRKPILLAVGTVFTRLTIIGPPERRSRYIYWPVRCSCGKLFKVDTSNLVSGRGKSCGCLRDEILSASFTTHGKSKSPIYAVWNSMIQRCFSSGNKNYCRYGERGISVSKRWRIFENFYADVGEPPFPRACLDRINNDGDYRKGNVKWSTYKENANNQRRTVKIKYKGKLLPSTTVADLCGVNENQLYQRLFTYKWPLERATNPRPSLHSSWTVDELGKPKRKTKTKT